MVAPTRPARNKFNALAMKVYNPLGFSKAYNFILWFIFAGALLGFTLARFMYLHFDKNSCPKDGGKGSNSAAPGECYYYETFTRYKVGILVHLAGILPSALFAVFQFTPFIRHRWIIVHRIMGYAALLLYVLSTVGALMIARHAFGGGLQIQAWVGFSSIITIISFTLAWVNIKRLQIEQHRAWMLRGWFYAGAIITTRMIMAIAANIISTQGYYVVWPCAKIEFALPHSSLLLKMYPACSTYTDGSNPNQVAIVEADMDGDTGVNAGAALGISFGTAVWLALAIHAVGVEIYLQLTPSEANRLRQVSYQRQVEAGMKKPGSAGLTADRLGDADKFVAESQRRDSEQGTASIVIPEVSREGTK